MIRVAAIIILSITLILTLCSWVDISQVSVYNGVIRGSSPLGGSQIQYYLDSYSSLGVTSSGSIFNNGSSVLHGAIQVAGSEYSLRIFAGQLPEVEYNGSWISYEIVPDQTPPHYHVMVYFAAFLAFLIIVLIIFLIMRGFAV